MVSCNSYSKVVMCSGNTTNLISHLRLNHSAIYAEVHPKLSKKGKPKSSSTSVRGLLAENDSNTRDCIVSSQGSDTGKSIIHHYFLVFTLYFSNISLVLGSLVVNSNVNLLDNLVDAASASSSETNSSYSNSKYIAISSFSFFTLT